jgi:peptide/nickel transport system substrate-binding protein
MTSRRREFLQTSFALVSAGAVGILPGLASAAGEASGSDPAPGTRGGSLSMGIYSEPNFLTSAFSTAGPPLSVSTKIFDGLLDYDEQFRPRPKLAIAWESSGDGLNLTLKLRRDVTWHDGNIAAYARAGYFDMGYAADLFVFIPEIPLDDQQDER